MPRPPHSKAAARYGGGGKFARAGAASKHRTWVRDQDSASTNSHAHAQQQQPHNQAYSQDYGYAKQAYAHDYYHQGYPQQSYQDYYDGYYADDRYGYSHAGYSNYNQQQSWGYGGHQQGGGGGGAHLRWGDDGYAQQDSHPNSYGSGAYSAQYPQPHPHPHAHSQSVDYAPPSAPKAMRKGYKAAHYPQPPHQDAYNNYAESSSSGYSHSHPYRRGGPPSNMTPPPGVPKGPSSFKPPPAIRAAPRPEYIETASQEPRQLSEDQAKDRQLLVILDLNGTLVFRAKSGSGRALDSVRAIPRPFLLCFLQYCLGTSTHPTAGKSASPPAPETKTARPHGSHFWAGSTKPQSSGRAQVVVWSSAQPYNVDSMVRASFDPDVRASILRIWARDTLVPQRFFQLKAESIKDLEIVWAELNAHANALPSPGRLMAEVRDKLDQAQPDDAAHQEREKPVSAALEAARTAQQLGPWGQQNTVLVDDSVAKARLQPFNHLLIPEFGKKEAEAMRKFIRQELAGQATAQLAEEETEEDQEELEYDSDLSIGNNGAAPAEQPSVDGKKKSKKDKNHVRESRLDDVLLQTIGVLETLRHQANVSAFIRAGGIKGYGEEKHWNEKQRTIREGQNNTPEFWSRKGREACESLGIEVKAWKQSEAANATAALLV